VFLEMVTSKKFVLLLVSPSNVNFIVGAMLLNCESTTCMLVRVFVQDEDVIDITEVADNLVL
jgi:hypothetical protein